MAFADRVLNLLLPSDFLSFEAFGIRPWVMTGPAEIVANVQSPCLLTGLYISLNYPKCRTKMGLVSDIFKAHSLDWLGQGPVAQCSITVSHAYLECGQRSVQGLNLKKVNLLGSNLASVTDLKRIQTPHSLCCDFGGYKTFTTRWSGCRVQV